jgi:hypothetical protein
MKLSKFVPYYDRLLGQTLGLTNAARSLRPAKIALENETPSKQCVPHCSRWCLNRILVTELPIQLNCPQTLQTRSTLAR